MKTAYINGRVYTGEDSVSCFAVQDGHFTAVGSLDQALQGAEKVIDLKDTFVCAGFNDSHLHLLNYGQTLNMPKLYEHTDSLAAMLDCFKTYLSVHPVAAGQWLKGRGWNQDYFSDVSRMPNRFDLDTVSKEIPLVAIRCCGHCLVVNSKALELAGITADTKCANGGCIGKENGILDGRFYDNAMDLIYAAIPDPDKETIKKYIASAAAALNSYGITSCQSDDYCAFANVDYEVINEAYRELASEGKLSVRVYEQANIPKLALLKPFLERHRLDEDDDFFRIGPLKILGDGSLGARTACLSRPYHDDPSTSGLTIFSKQEFDELIAYANRQDKDVAVHTIGDSCLDMVLSAIEKALKEHPRTHRHGIVHCQVTREEQLKKIKDLSLHVYAQTIFLDYDNQIVGKRLDEELYRSSYNFKTLLKTGVTVSNGSDCPVELPDALKGMECAITRCSIAENSEPYLPQEAFTYQEALNSFTSASAQASYDEKRKGLIKEGYLADFVLLDQDFFATAAKKLHEIKVLATYVGGSRVY